MDWVPFDSDDKIIEFFESKSRVRALTTYALRIKWQVDSYHKDIAHHLFDADYIATRNVPSSQ